LEHGELSQEAVSRGLGLGLRPVSEVAVVMLQAESETNLAAS
jgi:hypothetical protein